MEILVSLSLSDDADDEREAAESLDMVVTGVFGVAMTFGSVYSGCATGDDGGGWRAYAYNSDSTTELERNPKVSKSESTRRNFEGGGM